MNPKTSRVGKIVDTWGAWVNRWNAEDVTLPEQLGLLHAAFDVHIKPGNTNLHVERIAFFLSLANDSVQDKLYRKSGGDRLAEKARSVIATKIMKSQVLHQSPLSLIYSGSTGNTLLPLLVGMFCDRDESGWGNWQYVSEKSGSEFVNLTLSVHYVHFVRNVLRFGPPTLDMKDVRTKVMRSAFVDAPDVFCKIMGELGHQFKTSDLFDLLEWLGLKEAIQGISIPEMLMSSQVSSAFGWAIGRKMGGRVTMSNIRHWEAFILFATHVQEQALRE